MREGLNGKFVFSGIMPIGPEGNETEIGPIFAIWGEHFLFEIPIMSFLVVSYEEELRLTSPAFSAMTPMPDGQTIVGVFPCLNEGNSTDFYNTMVQMNVTDPANVPQEGNPPFRRLGNGRLFYANEVYVSVASLACNFETEFAGYLAS